jgi:hypothetical protein
VVRVPWSHVLLEIVFEGGWCCFAVKESDENPDYGAPIVADETEIIGNIYENPELLKAD